MVSPLLLIASFLSPPASNAAERVQWQKVDQLCGQLQLAAPEEKTIIVDGKAKSRLYTAYIEGAMVTLYPATAAERECCAASPIATVRSRKYGAFEFRRIQPGYYWLQVQTNGSTQVIPLHLTSDFNEKACSDSSVRRSVVVDSAPPKIETRIR